MAPARQIALRKAPKRYSVGRSQCKYRSKHMCLLPRLISRWDFGDLRWTGIEPSLKYPVKIEIMTNICKILTDPKRRVLSIAVAAVWSSGSELIFEPTPSVVLEAYRVALIICGVKYYVD